jgi:hypothetical protein
MRTSIGIITDTVYKPPSLAGRLYQIEKTMTIGIASNVAAVKKKRIFLIFFSLMLFNHNVKNMIRED